MAVASGLVAALAARSAALRKEFLAVGVAYPVSKEGVFRVSPVGPETGDDKARLFEKVAATEAFKAMGVSAKELFAHFFCANTFRLVGKAHGDWPGTITFIPTAHHLPTAIFSMPITQRGSTTPSPSRFSHDAGPTATADAHHTGFSHSQCLNHDFSYANSNSLATSNFGWDTLAINNGLLKCQGDEGARLVDYWREGGWAVVAADHVVMRPPQVGEVDVVA